MQHLVLKKIKSPTQFASFIYSDDSPKSPLSEISWSTEESIFSPKKTWYNNEIKFSQMQYPPASEFCVKEDTFLTQDEDQKIENKYEIQEQEQEEQLLIESLPFQKEFPEEETNLLETEVDLIEHNIQQESKLNTDIKAFDEEFDDCMTEYKLREEKRLLRIKRRRKIRRANNKIKAKVRKLGDHWIKRKELFPNVFRITSQTNKDLQYIDWEYQDLSRKFVLPEKKQNFQFILDLYFSNLFIFYLKKYFQNLLIYIIKY